MEQRMRDVERKIEQADERQRKSEAAQSKSHETIMRKLGEMSQQQSAFVAEARFDREKIVEHHKTLYGSNGSPGMKTAQDRLVQDARRMSRLIWIVVGSLVSTVIGGCATAITIFARGG